MATSGKENQEVLVRRLYAGRGDLPSGPPTKNPPRIMVEVILRQTPQARRLACGLVSRLDFNTPRLGFGPPRHMHLQDPVMIPGQKSPIAGIPLPVYTLDR